MSEITTVPSKSFLERLFPASWTQIALVMAVLAVLSLTAVTLDGLWGNMWSEGYWSILLPAPTVVIYILISILVTLGQCLLSYILVELGIN